MAFRIKSLINFNTLFMKNIFFCGLSLIICLQTTSYAQGHNIALQTMADADQKSRSVANIDWQKLNREDSLRRIQVMELIKQGKVITGKDHLNAGIVFQHGNDSIASALAVKSFKTALELDSTLNRWWYPAAVDRDLMRRKLPQIYGTQFIKNKATNNKWQRYNVDTTQITDQERRYYGVETLAEQKTKERLMNQQSISAYYAQTKSIDETLIEIKRQFHEGSLSAYNVSEEAINNFGYQLLGENKEHDALKIFELNTQLYPNAYNAFDSYGEILLKLGKNKKAKKAYKKSLQLNAQNENAIKVLRSL